MRGILLIGFCVAALYSWSQPNDALWRPVDSIAEHAISIGAAPGIQVVVMHKGDKVLHRTYGFHTYDSLQSVRITDIYDLASITKVAAATLSLMKLQSEGLFDLDTTIAAYFPEFRKSNKGDLVWRDVLAHQARLKAWIPYWESTVRKNGKYKHGVWRDQRSRKFATEVTPDLWLKSDYKKKIYKAIKKSPLNTETGYVYSGLAFYLVPELVERLSGISFTAYLDERIYRPLGLDTIGFNPLKSFPAETIIPTENDTFFRQVQIHGRVHDEGAAMMGGVSGNAGLFSTAEELAALAQFLLDRGIHDGDTILAPEIVDEYTRCQFCTSGNHRGLGFDKPIFTVDPDATSVSVSPTAGPNSYGHSGYTGTLVWIDPDEELIFIFLSNRVYRTRLNRKLYTENIRPAMMEAVYRGVRSDRNP